MLSWANKSLLLCPELRAGEEALEHFTDGLWWSTAGLWSWGSFWNTCGYYLALLTQVDSKIHSPHSHAFLGWSTSDEAKQQPPPLSKKRSQPASSSRWRIRRIGRYAHSNFGELKPSLLVSVHLTGLTVRGRLGEDFNLSSDNRQWKGKSKNVFPVWHGMRKWRHDEDS